MNARPIRIIAALPLCAAPVIAGDAGPVPQRDVQFRAIDAANAVIEIRNFGDTAMPLEGWRFCSHSNAQARRYTSPDALDGVTLEPDASMFVHMNDDAPGEPLRFNASDLGSFANNFGQGPWAIQLYWPNGGSLSFASNDDMVDHIQWSVNGVNNAVAGSRSQQAVDAGLWTAANDWIATSGNSLTVTLVPQGGLLHGPDDYDVAEPPTPCNDADLAAPFGVLDLNDIGAFVAAFSAQDPAADIAPPAGVWDLNDLGAFVTAFTAGCP